MEHKFLRNISSLHSLPAALFLKTIQQNQLGHAYLFYGYEGIGKEAFAIELARHLLCERGPLELCEECDACQQSKKFWHPDLKIIFPLPAKTSLKENEIIRILERKSMNPFVRLQFPGKNTFIGIDAIRELKNYVYEQPHQGTRKIILLFDVDQMRVEASNALLKILEEPPPYVHFILTTSRISRLLPTILSRCQTIHFERPDIREILAILRKYKPGLNENELVSLLKISNLNIKKTLEYLEDSSIELISLFRNFLSLLINRDAAEFMKWYYTEVMNQKKEFLLVFYEWLLLILLDLYYFFFQGRKEMRMQLFQKYYPEISLDEDQEEELLHLLMDLEQLAQELQDEHNLNEHLINQVTFEKLYSFFFQVPVKIED